jgi:hypothetical protein
MKILKISLFLVTCTMSLQAQVLFRPLNNDANALIEPELNKVNTQFHTSIKPYMQSEVDTFINSDSIVQKELYFDNSVTKRSLLYRKVRKENLINLDTGDFHLSINPLLAFELGRDFVSNTPTFINTKGLMISGSIGKKLSFYTSYYENQGTFVPYVDAFIRENNVVPGQGFSRDFKKGFDYGMASGYISYTTGKYFNIQFGHDKNFIGDGYRSLLLSDNAFNYPFFKITTTIWKIKYMNMWSQYEDIHDPIYQGAGYNYLKKYSAIHYLSYNVCKRLNIGLFEAVIFAPKDTNGYRGIELNYLNPIVFYRPVEFSLGSPDNMMMGFNWKYKVNNHNQLYGQIMLDEFKLHEVLNYQNGWYGNKQGLQFGLKSYNLFTIKNLSFQTEFNVVRPYTYSETIHVINYAHYNQALAHPLGSNFKESVSFLRYRYKAFYGVLKVIYAIHGADTAGLNLGNDLYKSYLSALPKTTTDPNGHEYGTYVGMGLKKTLTFTEFKIGYIINPKTNLCAEVGISYRALSDINNTQYTNFIFIGIKTALNNFYYDF